MPYPISVQLYSLREASKDGVDRVLSRLADIGYAAVEPFSMYDMTPREFRRLMKEKMGILKMDESFATRYLNEGFSGGEKKRAEILQMALLEPTMAILDETVGDHPGAVFHLHALASALIEVGRAEDAMKRQLRAVEMAERLVGTEHPWYAHALSGLAAVESSMGDSKPALDHASRASEILARYPGSPLGGPSKIVLARALLGTGQHARALERYREALHWHEEVNPDHPARARILGQASFRYYFTLEPGVTPAQIQVQQFTSECGGNAVSGPTLLSGSTYFVTVNNFLVDGGDNFGTFATIDPALRVGAGIDLDALIAYLGEFSPVSAPGTDRVNELN